MFTLFKKLYHATNNQNMLYFFSSLIFVPITGIVWFVVFSQDMICELVNNKMTDGLLSPYRHFPLQF